MKPLSLFLSLAIALILIAVPIVYAAPIVPGLPAFGGHVQYMFPCTCSGGNFWLYMWPFYGPEPVPTGGALVYQPGFTYVYNYHAIPMVGINLAGQYFPGVQACYIYVGTGCAPVPSAGLINAVGTSLTPSETL